MTLEEFAGHRRLYLRAAMQNRAPTTKLKHHQDLGALEEFVFFGGHGLDTDIESVDLYIKWQEHLKRTCSINHASERCRNTSTFYGWLTKAGIMKVNPASLVPCIQRAETQKKPPITKEEYARLLEASSGTVWHWAIISGWWTGMSLVDICELTLDSIDLDQWCIRRRRRKSRTDAIIPIVSGTEFHSGLLEKIRSVDMTDGIHRGGKYYVDAALAFRYLTDGNNINAHMRKIFQAAGVSDTKTFHCFRVSFCSRLANGGANLAVACKITGHADPETFSKRYLHASTDALHKAMHQLGGEQ